jgi:hypothetical protein
MRALLEFLGIVAPSDTRREPVALPAWIRKARIWIVPALAIASTLAFALLRALLT